MYKVELFRATVESILQYGSESWTITSLLTKRLDGTYTKLLRAALNIHWRDHQRNVSVYGNIPKISETTRKRRLSQAGRCWRSNEIVKDLLFWEPTRGKRCKGRPEKTYIHQLTEDTDMNQQDLKKKNLEDRQKWKNVISSEWDQKTKRTNSKHPCGICSKNVSENVWSIQCADCLFWIHRTCLKMSVKEMRTLQNWRWHCGCEALNRDSSCLAGSVPD